MIIIGHKLSSFLINMLVVRFSNTKIMVRRDHIVKGSKFPFRKL